MIFISGGSEVKNMQLDKINFIDYLDISEEHYDVINQYTCACFRLAATLQHINIQDIMIEQQEDKVYFYGSNNFGNRALVMSIYDNVINTQYTWFVYEPEHIELLNDWWKADIKNNVLTYYNLYYPARTANLILNEIQAGYTKGVQYVNYYGTDGEQYTMRIDLEHECIFWIYNDDVIVMRQEDINIMQDFFSRLICLQQELDFVTCQQKCYQYLTHMDANGIFRLWQCDNRTGYEHPVMKITYGESFGAYYSTSDTYDISLMGENTLEQHLEWIWFRIIDDYFTDWSHDDWKLNREDSQLNWRHNIQDCRFHSSTGTRQVRLKIK